MSNKVRIALEPLGESFEVLRGTPLQDVLFEHGVEFPCGGKGRCKGCRIKVLEGDLPITPEQQKLFTQEELNDGWRLACRCNADNDLKLEIAQWEATILSDQTQFAFTPGEGWGVAVDIGTTTLVAQLVDLQNGNVRAVQSSLNPQARHGGDIMSRVQFGLKAEGLRELTELIRKEIGAMIERLLAEAHGAKADIRRVTLVGNTVMHHLFSGLSVESLSAYPFNSETLEMQRFAAKELGWEIPGNPEVWFLPCMGGFVGSDVLAGVWATRILESEELVGLVDLGTNGEIVMGNKEKLICASTAAGPAFEGAKISKGMRAVTGAVSEVHVEDGALHCHVLGNVKARGVCGSGLVDAVAGGLELGWIDTTGRFSNGRDVLALCDSIGLTQKDVRELQLAKGAIAAGFEILCDIWGGGGCHLDRLNLAGAFGNYINRSSARRIGLLNYPEERIVPVGNSALLGAKQALFVEAGEDFSKITGKVEHVSLSIHQRFQEVFADSMLFPEDGQ